MDLISKPAMEVSALALDGLAQRHKLLSANIANADTQGYKRRDVTFEGQLAQIVNFEDQKQLQKEKRSASLTYLPNSLDNIQSFDEQSARLANTEIYSDFNPQISSNDTSEMKSDGNNVNLEYEMAELAKNGTKYSAITTLEEKMFRGIQDVIKGAN